MAKITKGGRVTNLVAEILKKIPSNNRKGSSYEVTSGAFKDSRKNVYLVKPNEIGDKFKGSVSSGACFNYNLRQQLKEEKV